MQKGGIGMKLDNKISAIHRGTPSHLIYCGMAVGRQGSVNNALFYQQGGGARYHSIYSLYPCTSYTTLGHVLYAFLAQCKKSALFYSAGNCPLVKEPFLMSMQVWYMQ